MDRLLASPRYGERWGRHWLDVARYADSAGYESDADRPTAYPYRDFVIRALNDDMPFDEFVRRQLAGDEIRAGRPAGRRRDRVPGRRAERRPARQAAGGGAAAAAVHRAGRHGRDHRRGPARPDGRLCPMPRPQVRPDPDARLLPPARRPALRGPGRGAARDSGRGRAGDRRARAEWDKQRQAAEAAPQGVARRAEEGARAAAPGRRRSTGCRSPTPEKALLRDKPDSAEAKALAKKHEKALAVTDADGGPRWTTRPAGGGTNSPGSSRRSADARAEGAADRPGVPGLRAEAGGELAVPPRRLPRPHHPGRTRVRDRADPRQAGGRLLERGPRRRRPGRHHLPAAGPGGVGHRRRPRGRAAAGPGDRQPGLAAPLRRGTGPHAERLRGPRRPADAPGAARVAGRRPRRPRLEAQAAAPDDPAQRHLPTGELVRPGEGEGRPGQPAPVADAAAAAGGRGAARRHAGRERDAEPPRCTARRSSRRSRPTRWSPAT